MSIAAAIRLTSEDEARVIEHAAAFARVRAVPCFVISVVGELPYGRCNDDERQIVRRNLDCIAACEASPVLQEGSDRAATLVSIARLFGVRILFVNRAIAEELLHRDPPFDIVAVASD